MKKHLLFTLLSAAIMMILMGVSSSAAIAGDINGDGAPDVNDARTALRLAIGLTQDGELSADQCLMADYDYNGITDVADARLILRAAILLDETKHYFAASEISPATCTDGGQVLMSCTECTAESSFVKEIPALGHDLSVLEIAVEKTCDVNGVYVHKCSRCEYFEDETIPAGHEWIEATCEQAKHCALCGIEEGAASGHTVRIGYCANCGEYISELGEESKAILSYLNGGYKKLKEAYDTMNIAASEDFYNVQTAKCKESYGQFVSAYNDYYYQAYVTCGDEAEFASAKIIIGDILDLIYEAYTQLKETTKTDISSEGRMNVFIAIDGIMESITEKNYLLRDETVKWKE